jgi:two-component system, chemotaxis family, sensor kinase CheA
MARLSIPTLSIPTLSIPTLTAAHSLPLSAGPVNAINLGRIEVNSELVIVKVHDKVCQHLLGEDQLLKQNFAHILQRKVTPDRYQQLLSIFHTLVKKKNIIETKDHKNPFDCLKIRTVNAQGTPLTRYLRCEFQRAKDFDKNGIWQVTIQDISKAVRVSKIIKLNKVRAELKVNTLMSLIQFDKDLIEEFLQAAVLSIKELMKNLMDGARGSGDSQHKLEAIYCIAHQMKGDSAILNLEGISKKVHAFENHLSLLNGKHNISQQDFVQLREPLKEIIDGVKEVTELFNQIRDGGWSSSQNTGGDSLIRQLKHLIKKVAADSKKRVVLVEDGCMDSSIPLKYQRIVSRVLTQLARNSIVHGIEDEQTRIQANKTPYGCLHLSTHRDKKYFVLTVRDDGRGINLLAVKQAALSSGLFDPTAVMSWKKPQLLSALFKPGFSTAKNITQHAGRGIGLDVIKSSVEKCGGKMNLKSVAGQFTEFSLSFPL